MTLFLGASDFLCGLKNKNHIHTKFESLMKNGLYFPQNMFLGPKLPFKLSQASMVTSPTGRGVVIIGGWNEKSSKYSTSLFELDGRSMEWVKLKQKLGTHSSHVFTNPEFSIFILF